MYISHIDWEDSAITERQLKSGITAKKSYWTDEFVFYVFRRNTDRPGEWTLQIFNLDMDGDIKEELFTQSNLNIFQYNDLVTSWLKDNAKHPFSPLFRQ